MTEAEWEYAARASTTTAYTFGDSITGQQAQFSLGQSVEVGTLPANAFGLHDMHGNVWEWVEDCYAFIMRTRQYLAPRGQMRLAAIVCYAAVPGVTIPGIFAPPTGAGSTQRNEAAASDSA